MDCGHFWTQEQVKTRTLERHKHAAPKDFLRVTSAPPARLLQPATERPRRRIDDSRGEPPKRATPNSRLRPNLVKGRMAGESNFWVKTMRDLFSIVERYGFVGVQDAEKVYDLPPAELEKLHSEAFKHIYDRQNKRIWGAGAVRPNDTFSFHASASIRGASGCSALSCRLQKLDFLGRYAALYASELTLPLTMPTPGTEDDVEELRDALNLDLISLLFLRPIITVGIVVPVVMRTWHCVHEREWIKNASSLIHDFSQVIAKAVHSDFTLRYQVPDKSPSGRPTVYLEGPEEYIEHGGLVRVLERTPKWLPQRRRFDKQGTMEIRGLHKRHLLELLFTDIANNMTFYFAYGLKRRSRYLSDMPGETEFLDWAATRDHEEMTAKTEALSELQHCVPVLAELPIATILRIRKEEQDAFEAYRDAVTKVSSMILSSAKRVSKRAARQMLRDAIEPELRKMNRDIRTYRKVRRSRVVGGAISIAAGVMLGAYAGLPSVVSTPLAAGAALVGGQLAGKAAEAICSHGPEFRQKNDLYFLLRLTNEAV